MYKKAEDCSDPEVLKRKAKALDLLYENLYDDGSGHWLPDWCVGDGPTMDEFLSCIEERHMKDD